MGITKYKYQSMKKLFFLICILFISGNISFAQQKKYISYTVKSGETIKSIAKNYNLSTRDLLRLNPGVKRRPKSNTVIIVPNLHFKKEILKADELEENSEFYTVKPKETLFGISKKFNITIEDLKKANPKLIDGLKIGMQLIIPEPINNVAIDSTTYVMHKVIKEDTLYNLSKKYEVTEEELIALNPELIDGLKLGMILKIKPIVEEDDKRNVFIENLNLDKELKVYFMLPYGLNKLNDSIQEEGFSKTNSLLNITTDFHLGASIAIDSLRKKGLHIKAEFIDTENSKYKLQYIINKYNFTKNDVVIGPLFYDKAYWIANHINSNVVAPFYSKNQEKLSAGNLIKTAPNDSFLASQVIDYIKEKYKGENLVLINDDKPENQHKLWHIVNELKQIDSVQGISVIKSTKGFIDVDKLTEKMAENQSNWVLLISNDLITTVAAVNSLKSFDETFNVTLFSLKKDRNYDKINNNYLGKLNFTYPSTENIDFNKKHYNAFYKMFKKKNFALPSKYAIRGFDVTYDILSRLASGENMEEALLSGESFRLNDVFYYVRNQQNELENEGVHIFQLNKELDLNILKKEE
jgi:LysM repeat protein/ABC-type branched-subunit amino acid transport system substrate-binding protein